MSPTPSPVPRDLEGKTILVAGACGHPGREVALALARRGAHLSLFDWSRFPLAGRDSERIHQDLTTLAADIEALGSRVLVIRGDIRNEADVSRVVDKTIQLFGSLDVVFNGMQLPAAGVCWDPFDDEWDTMIDVNLKGAWMLSKWVVPEMVRRGGGTIFHNVTDERAEDSCLWGIWGLTKNLSSHLVSQGIRIEALDAAQILQWAEGSFSPSAR